jgi:phage baseplate assembly protein W
MNDEVPVGIILPYTRGNDGFFSQTYSDLHRARVNLSFLLQTMKGERPMMPTYGSELHEIIFEPNMEQHADDLFEDAVHDAATTWMPEVTIMSVVVHRDNINFPNHAKVAIQFRLNNVPDSDQEIVIPVSGGPRGSAD